MVNSSSVYTVIAQVRSSIKYLTLVDRTIYLVSQLLDERVLRTTYSLYSTGKHYIRGISIT